MEDEEFRSIEWMWDDLAGGFSLIHTPQQIHTRKMYFAMGAWAYMLVQRNTVRDSMDENASDEKGSEALKRVRDDTLAFINTTMGYDVETGGPVVGD